MRTCLRVVAALVILIGLCSSATAQVRREVLEVATIWNGKLITLRPELHIPATPGPYGAVVLINSSSGSSDFFFDKAPAAFAKVGIATVNLDTYTARGIGNTNLDQGQLRAIDQNLDALEVLSVLRSHARIKADKVAVMGHSRGAILVTFLASAGWYKFAGIANPRTFDAGIALSPDCSLQFSNFMEGAYSDFLAFMGERDDNTLPGPCIAMFERAKAQGKNVQFHVVPKAGHGFSTRGESYNAQVFTMQGCSDDPLVVTPPDTRAISINARKVVAYEDIQKVCGKRGAHGGGEHDAADGVLETAGAWLKARGW